MLGLPFRQDAEDRSWRGVLREDLTRFSQVLSLHKTLTSLTDVIRFIFAIPTIL